MFDEFNKLAWVPHATRERVWDMKRKKRAKVVPDDANSGPQILWAPQRSDQPNLRVRVAAIRMEEEEMEVEVEKDSADQHVTTAHDNLFSKEEENSDDQHVMTAHDNLFSEEEEDSDDQHIMTAHDNLFSEEEQGDNSGDRRLQCSDQPGLQVQEMVIHMEPEEEDGDNLHVTRTHDDLFSEEDDNSGDGWT